MPRTPSSRRTPSTNRPGLVNTNEAARYLGVHPETLRRHHRAGRISGGYMVGGALRFDLDELREDLRPRKAAS